MKNPINPVWELRPYQEGAVQHVVQWLCQGQKPGAKILYSAPTGSGKSVIELALHAAMQRSMLVTPRLEIVSGMLQKLGIDPTGWSDNRLAEEAAEYGIFTPIRLRNMLAKGVAPYRPDVFILDEAHHGIANTYQELSAYVPEALWIGLTATAYRGSPVETAKYLEEWGDVHQILSYPQAIALGVVALPTPKVWPMVDDDMIEVVNGELKLASVENASKDIIQAVIERCCDWCPEHAGKWDKPTMISVSSALMARLVTDAFNEAGLPAEMVTQETPRHERNRIFAAVLACKCVLVQIDVVSEGVDLPLRRLIDLKPTLSPVRWMQQIGRIMRPGGLHDIAEYYCTNRNLERHGYLFDGAIPAIYIKAAQDAFEKPTKRVGLRAFGVETMGRFQAVEIPLASGIRAFGYFLAQTDQFAKTEYATLLSPNSTEVVYAKRVNDRTPDGMFKWGKWERIAAPPADFKGFSSIPGNVLTVKQAAWWARAAGQYGLDAGSDAVTKKNFQVLPLLKELGYSFGV